MSTSRQCTAHPRLDNIFRLISIGFRLVSASVDGRLFARHPVPDEAEFVLRCLERPTAGFQLLLKGHRAGGSVSTSNRALVRLPGATSRLEIVAGVLAAKPSDGAHHLLRWRSRRYLLVTSRGGQVSLLAGPSRDSSASRAPELRPERIALIDEAATLATVIPRTHRVLEIAREPFLKLVRKQPILALKVMTAAGAIAVGGRPNNSDASM